MGTRLLRIFKFLVLTALVISSLILISAVIIWRNPQWIVNPQNLQRLLTFYGLQDQIRFEDLNLSLESPRFFEQRLGFSVRKFCFDRKNPRVLFCADKIELDLRIVWTSWRPHLEGPPRLLVQGSELDYEHSISETPEPILLPEIPPPSFENWLGFLSRLLPQKSWGRTQWELRRADIQWGPATRIQGQAEISSSDTTAELNLRGQWSLHTSGSKEPLFFSVQGQIDLPQQNLSFSLESPAFFGSSLRMNLGTRLEAELEAKRPSEVADVSVLSRLRWEGQNLTWTNGLNVRPQKLPFRGPRWRRPPDFRVQHQLEARLQLRQDQWQTRWTQTLFSPRLSGLSVKVSNQGSLRLRSQTPAEAGQSLDWKNALKLDSVDGDIRTEQFAQLVRDLAWTTLQIPAPFYRMRGPLELKFQSLQPSLETVPLEVQFTSRLQDPRQALHFDWTFKGQLNHPTENNRKLSGISELRLLRINLELPRLSPLSIPRFTMDSRLTETRPSKSKAPAPRRFAWDVDFRVRTPGPPLLLQSNLVSSPIPLSVNADLRLRNDRDTQVSAQVAVHPMILELFRRKVQLERIDLNQQPNGTTAIDGLFVYRTSEITVRIRILGTTQKPRLVFESDPPLTRHQLISIVIFGKSLSELTQDEMSSAQNLEQAFADGALGIFSLVVLASTPIESISFNPSTQTYVARMKLGDRMSLALGSDFENRQSLSIRRQLWGAWSIKTELESDGVDKDHLSTFLEWFRRF